MNEETDRQRWSRVDAVFHAALEREPEERGRYVADACGSDESLRAEVERLLAAHVAAGSFLEQSPVAMAGRRIGRYEVERLLGAGGMGAVYLARDTELGRLVALKLAPSAEGTARLRREAQHASRLSHPHICTIHEVGTVGGQTFIAMEHVEGRSLSDLASPGGLPLDKVLRYGAQVADALAHAHARGVVHRDVKAANVIVTVDDRAKVLDFGLARRLPAEAATRLQESQAVTSPGVVAGTLSCMAPELLRGDEADARSDIWALGVLLHEMATGSRPFAGATPFELSAAILHEPPALPARIPAPLRGVIQRCLEKDPDRRYQEAGQVRSALEAAARDALPESAAPVDASRRRWRRPVVALAVALVLALAGLTWRLWPAPSPVGAPGTGGPPVLAVLAFENLANDPETSWLSRGVQSMLVTGLAQTSGLAVVSAQRLHEVARETGAASLDTLGRAGASDVARRAGAGATVVGSIAQAGSAFRIDAQVEDLLSGRVLAATSVSGPNLFALVDELARRIRTAVGIRDAGPYRPTADVSSASLEAYRLYSQGVDAFANLRGDDAQALLQSAVALDPTFAEAYLELALLSGPAGRPAERRRYLDRANEFRDRLSAPRRLLMDAELARDQGRYRDAAQALDALRAAYPGVDAVSTMAMQLYSPVVGPLADGNALLAITSEAVAANPASALARNNHAYALLYAGRFEEAVRELETYVRLAPREPNPYDGLGETYLVAGQPDRALVAYDRALAIDPRFLRGGRAWTLAILGRYDEALGEQGSPPHLRAVMLARVGRVREARETVSEAIRATRDGGDFARAGALQFVAVLLSLEAGQYARAIGECEAAAQTFASVPEDRRRFTLALGHLLCGVAEVRRGRMEAARARLKAQARLYESAERSEMWWHHALAGEIALAERNLVAAEQAFARAEPARRRFFSRLAEGSVLSNDLIFRDGSARLAIERGDSRLALDIYRRLLTYGPEQKWLALFEPRYVLAMARLQDTRGEREAARGSYERFTQLWKNADPGLPERAEAQRAIARLGSVAPHRREPALRGAAAPP